jgi:dolichol-phosphate mannosyltransferase
MFLRGIFTWIGFRQTGIEYVAQKRAGGYSKYSLSKMLQLATAGILSFSTKPLQLGIFVGVIFSLLSFIMAMWTVVEFFLDKSIPSGWTTLVVLLLMFSGIQLIVLGIIGAYIGGIYEEVKDRPRYIIDEEISCNE